MDRAGIPFGVFAVLVGVGLGYFMLAFPEGVGPKYPIWVALRDEGCNVLDKTDDSEFGKFDWVMDPEGNKVELWQPPEGQ